MADTFATQVKTWVLLDNQLHAVNLEAKRLRAERAPLETTILSYVATNQLASTTIAITDGKLRFATTKQTAPLTLTHVEKCLSRTLHDPQLVQQLIDVISTTRDVKLVSDIKRTYRPA